jgi:lipopolysaccharide O-acetyltransferase
MNDMTIQLTRQSQRAARLYWRSRLGSFGSGSSLGRPRQLTNAGRIEIGNNVIIRQGVRLEVPPAVTGQPPVGSIRIGDGSQFEDFVSVGAAADLTIGEGCLFAAFVYVSDHDHGLSGPPERILSRPLQIKPVTIGKRVWLGQHVCVLKGVSIGDESVIGAGSIVTRDIPPRVVAAGSPARVIRALG